jgi:DNA-binding MarR family transcriptional regulator
MPSFTDCNCLAVRSAARHMTQFYDRLLAATGLRATQFSILAALNEMAPLTINGLAKVMVMDRTTLGRNVLPLERDGLIRIAPAAGDRRAKELHLTKAGAKRFQEAVKEWSAVQARFEERFGPKRSAELRALMRAVVATDLEASPTDAHG